MKNFGKILLTIAILIFGITNPNNSIDRLLTGLLFLYTVCISFGNYKYFLNISFKKYFKFLVFPIIIIFIITSYGNSKNLRNYLSHEPINGTYRTDMDDFLKTYYLMKQGNDYYSSYKMAVENNPFKGVVSTNLWSWKFPTVYYFWKILPGNAQSIYFVFIILAIFTLYSAYLFTANNLSEKNRYLAILSPYLLYPYLHYAGRDATFLQTEWWAVMLLIIGAYFMSVKKIKLTIICFSLSILIRELMIIPILFAFGYLLIKKNHLWRIFVVPILLFIVATILHMFFVKNQIPLTNQFFTPRIHILGYKIIIATLAFGSWEFYFYKLRLFIWFYLIALMGVYYLKNDNKAILLGSLIFPLLMLFLGSSIYNDYWGIFYIPVTLVNIPLIFNKL
ncbi:MAG: hypothetical protein UR52_C0001G0012 [Candidatus Gottesmanbacteria bacterium GW2011_GWA1_34_13]|uniref:Glycosyltransferase RgtA/B/C/D-like domain-containing protein n=1 Tax=Candidatus Gottesmanbacteria bacterium GW2011_GWA1_34_13 TaxID=1618434 RepID=A0A0G0DXP4_9BACT|nr:MAG: hypothetical protein UR52_C0001G0012 [Candidatus Gottesmanbacteria bacterium GW2011_GWA1_34_13]